MHHGRREQSPPPLAASHWSPVAAWEMIGSRPFVQVPSSRDGARLHCIAPAMARDGKRNRGCAAHSCCGWRDLCGMLLRIAGRGRGFSIPMWRTMSAGSGDEWPEEWTATRGNSKITRGPNKNNRITIRDYYLRSSLGGYM
jgi:hypothetical protein